MGTVADAEVHKVCHQGPDVYNSGKFLDRKKQMICKNDQIHHS